MNNTILLAEAIVLLELVEVLERKGRNIESSSIIIAVNNREIYRKIVEKIENGLWTKCRYLFIKPLTGTGEEIPI